MRKIGRYWRTTPMLERSCNHKNRQSSSQIAALVDTLFRLRLQLHQRLSDSRYAITAIAVAVIFVVGILIATQLASQGQPQQVTTTANAHSLTLTGTINPTQIVTVGSYVSGVVQDVSCDFNTQVKKGQLCAKIDPRPFQTVVAQSQANLATAKAQLEKDLANLNYAKANYERNASLVQKGWTSKDAFENIQSTYEQAKAQAALDKAVIAQRQAELDTAEVNLGYTDIISPVDGTVISRKVALGETVAASFQTPTLFLIAADLTKMELVANVSETNIGRVKEGEPVKFKVKAFPDRSFDGRVTQIRLTPQPVQNEVTYEVVGTVDNPELLLKPGMTATLHIPTEKN
jgi:HlyD family secretion protein